jgi:hypothetical protein
MAKYETMLCMDADLQHQPEQVPAVAKPVLSVRYIRCAKLRQPVQHQLTHPSALSTHTVATNAADIGYMRYHIRGHLNSAAMCCNVCRRARSNRVRTSAAVLHCTSRLSRLSRLYRLCVAAKGTVSHSGAAQCCGCPLCHHTHALPHTVGACEMSLTAPGS